MDGRPCSAEGKALTGPDCFEIKVLRYDTMLRHSAVGYADDGAVWWDPGVNWKGSCHMICGVAGGRYDAMYACGNVTVAVLRRVCIRCLVCGKDMTSGS